MPLSSNHSSDLLEKFKGKVIGHPVMLAAFKRIMDLIEEPADVEVAAVIGPTDAGKSTLVERISLIHNLQLFFGRFARDLVTIQPLTQPTPAAPTPEALVQKTTPLLASAENSATAAIPSEWMASIAEAKTPAEKAINPSTATGLDLENLLQESHRRGSVISMTKKQARQLGLVR